MNGRRRALGQHFLRDVGIARAIVDVVAPTKSDLVVEIGPGQGALTGELARRAGRVIALEVDRALAADLRARIRDVEIIDADARTWDYGLLSAPPTARYPIGGWSELVGRLQRHAQDLGVRVETQSRVEALPHPPVIVATRLRTSCMTAISLQ